MAPGCTEGALVYFCNFLSLPTPTEQTGLRKSVGCRENRLRLDCCPTLATAASISTEIAAGWQSWTPPRRFCPKLAFFLLPYCRAFPLTKMKPSAACETFRQGCRLLNPNRRVQQLKKTNKSLKTKMISSSVSLLRPQMTAFEHRL